MFANHPATVARSQPSNLEKAEAGWGATMPEWVRMLAVACDRTSQRIVANRLNKSSGYVSRIINHDYAGSYQEAETIVRAAFGDETVACPAWGDIPLSSCVRNRRRKGPPTNLVQQTCARSCPACIFNTDREED